MTLSSIHCKLPKRPAEEAMMTTGSPPAPSRPSPSSHLCAFHSAVPQSHWKCDFPWECGHCDASPGKALSFDPVLQHACLPSLCLGPFATLGLPSAKFHPTSTSSPTFWVDLPPYPISRNEAVPWVVGFLYNQYGILLQYGIVSSHISWSPEKGKVGMVHRCQHYRHSLKRRKSLPD